MAQMFYEERAAYIKAPPKLRVSSGNTMIR